MAETEETLASEANVGVLGWLGFIIVNFAAWGIITTASTIIWVLGFVICLLYTAALVGLALWLERKGAKKYHQFLNLFWVLAATFVFILGLYLSYQVIGKFGGDSDSNGGSDGGGDVQPPINNDLETLLPSSASTELREWAKKSSWQRGADFVGFGSTLFFEGQGDQGEEALLHVTGGIAKKVSPQLSNARSFVEFESKLLCVAKTSSSSPGVWQMDALGTATQVDNVLPNGTLGGQLLQLFVEGNTSTLYIKARYQCQDCWDWIDTILNTSLLSTRPTDARGEDPCSSLCLNRDTPAVLPYQSGPSGSGFKATLWGVIFVAALPMMVLAGVVLVKKRMPGLFVNLYGVVVVVVVVAYLLANEGTMNTTGSQFVNFLKAFLTSYTVLLWLIIAGWSLYSTAPPEWLEELKSWAVAFVGVSFFVIIHIDLEIPFRDDAWRWIVYALVTLWQLLLSAVVSRTVPMVSGAIGLFVIAWKVSWEIVEFAGLPRGELQMLAVLALLALQGIGIIVGAIFYQGNRDRIEEMVRAALRCNVERLKEVSSSPVVSTGAEV